MKFYAVPGVAAACIELQDRAKVDVNVLFFLLWNATERRALRRRRRGRDRARDRPLARDGGGADPQRAPRAEVAAAGRSTPRPPKGYRTRIKQVELEAERLQQEALYALAQAEPPGQSVADPVEAARASVSAYQGVIGPFPPGPLEAILSAFAKFEMPATDRAD